MNYQTGTGQQGHANAPIKALLLDDDAYDRRRIQRFTAQSDLALEICEVTSIGAMSRAVDQEAFDLLMIDYHLSEGSGLDAINIIKRNVDFDNTPIIMISGNQKSSVAVSAFRQGCHDFVAKDDLSPIVLQEAVLGALQSSQNAHHIQRAMAADLKHQVQCAIRDTLQHSDVQSALADSMRAAARSSGLQIGQEYSLEMQNFFSDYWADDEFAFKQ